MNSLVSLPKVKVKELCESKIKNNKIKARKNLFNCLFYILGIGQISREIETAEKLLKACEVTKHHIWVSLEDLEQIYDKRN